MKKKTMIEEMRERANKLSNGEALILLDHILKREGQEAMISIFMNEMPQIKSRISYGGFNLEGCRNINTQLANELIAYIEREKIMVIVESNLKESAIKKRL
ncbi:hypothetical protein HKL33_004841 [Salmonella enterica]|uniref:Uncharacterized protein n=1 Tax=Salmonella enterica TaxID=28901 RepID=A0A612B8A5_SALER|nr:hypothetical protein [Klebsiella michiganensis]EAT4092055.1 hypothetical protein [Salmonella enterica]EDT6092002.1 hypothetical protein [Salmonella enterica subsp. enterica serovar Ealing]EDU5237548.1 hypothetical protein [Salmonella enterica subsp. enterica serovar Braenderup]EEL1572577.1 hypothetical protein [Salmonella enterica subsp. enterica serovar Thompson]EEU9295256.1 hypothetical protein [Escherichia coli]EGF6331654.1 hypothetical protein [Salmonella enterica subsp. enterica serov